SVTMRVYRGTEDQTPDPAMEAIEGAAPAYRGLAYVVFEDMPLADFGNRIPQLAFEIEKSLAPDDPDALENALTAVTMIPGSGEFVYGATKVLRENSEGESVPENTHASSSETDFTVALDALLAAAPNLKSVSLVVSWFGDDLRLGACQLRPGVDAPLKTTTPYDWRAGGVDREDAHLISRINGAASYGGTPSDRAVIEAIGALKAAGLEVMLHPFILMDVPPGNGLPDPHGGAEQAAFPWRGRIAAGADDGTSAAAAAAASFFGTAAPGDFSLIDGLPSYFGTDGWTFRRMILHYAHLCAAAGGVDAFLIGSELRGVTTTRDGQGAYPAVAELAALAGDVASVLGPGAKLSYGADWSEYFGHHASDGSGDAYYHLDPFWTLPEIAFIGIDNYMPLADWRDGADHLDAAAGFEGPYDLDYLKANIEGGEGYDWFYASAADRDAQIRTPIADGAYGEPWIYRYKDLRNWWSTPHHNRPGGVRAATPTAWAPGMKPFRFTETGCPAIDRGANQPNVFVDPKSAESAAPYFSNGRRDDLAQRRFIEATHAYWRDPLNNPSSPVDGAPMIETDHLYVYAYDARPFPFFPALADVWGDGDNWTTGHWLNGRLGRAPLSLLTEALADPSGSPFDVAVDASRLEGVVAGYVVDRPLSPREAIEPLADVFQFDLVEAGALLRFQPRGGDPDLVLTTDDLVEGDDAAFSLSLAQEGDLPAAFRLGFIDEGSDYGPGVAEARDPAARPQRVAGAEIAAVMGQEDAEARARAILADAWVMREGAAFALPPSRAAIEPGDIVEIDLGQPGRRYRVTEIADRGARELEAVRVAPSRDTAPTGPSTLKPPAAAPVYGPPAWSLMDLPLLAEGDDPSAPYLAAYARPWPGGVALYREREGGAPV
ncbi:MAG: glycoside hydrolase/phage tail family protein, partial [Pseudomonadota bacterium]